MSAPAPIPQIRLTSEHEALVRNHLEEILRTRAFAGSKRAQDFLRLIVEHALRGEVDSLRERMIGAEMFKRPVDYDTANDSVVRVKATEMRKKLTQAYLESEAPSKVRIEVTPGSYVPRFIFHEFEPPALPGAIERKPPISLERLSGESANSGNSPRAVSAQASGKRLRGIRPVMLIATACLACAAIYVGFRGWPSFGHPRAEIRSVVVLPFENLSGDPKQEYFADGITEELIADLGQMSNLRVVSRTSAMSFKGTRKDLPDIARALSVDGVVEGSVLRQGSLVRITTRLIDAKDDRPLWGESITRNSTDVLATEGELAHSIASELSLKVSPQAQAHLSRAASVSMEAEDLYLQGMLNFHSGNCENAMDYFQRAIKADAHFASAYAALANCYGLLGEGGWMPYSEAFSNQKSNALRAISLDDSLSEGHAELANALLNEDWDWNGAEKEFRQALALNPNSARAHEQYGSYLHLIGNATAAIEEGKIAMKLDPLSGRAVSDLAYIYYFSRQYDQALSLLERAESRDPNLKPDLFAFADVYVEKGMYQASINEFLKLGNNPHALGHLGNAYARARQVGSAQEIITQLEKRTQKDQLGAYEIALVYTGLGQKDNAFLWLQRALENHDRGLLFLKIDPTLDPLRSDPRFDAFLLRVGLGKH